MRKRSGPRTDPYGTPAKISLTEGILICILIKLFSFLEVRAESFIGYATYAIDQQKTQAQYFPSFSCVRIFSITDISALSVDTFS